MRAVAMLATGLGCPQGPVICPDGSVVLTEIRHGRCTWVIPDGSTRVFSHTGGGPNCLAIGPDGAFYLCHNGDSRYVEGTSMGQGPHTGEHTTLYIACQGNRLSAILALRSHTAQGWVHSMTACHMFPYHDTAQHRGASPMVIIDSQVHAYEANTSQRPWHSVPNWSDHITGDEVVAAMA